MMGADYYQTESEIASLLAEGKVPIGIGQNTKIRYLFYPATGTSLIELQMLNIYLNSNKHVFRVQTIRNADFRIVVFVTCVFLT